MAPNPREGDDRSHGDRLLTALDVADLAGATGVDLASEGGAVALEGGAVAAEGAASAGSAAVEVAAGLADVAGSAEAALDLLELLDF